MNLGRYKPITSPAGIWNYQNLIGATVKIKSNSIASGLFGSDSEKLYKIEDIKFRLDRDGECVTSIHLIDSKKSYEWKDLEIISTNLNFYKKPICGEINCDESKCNNIS